MLICGCLAYHYFLQKVGRRSIIIYAVAKSICDGGFCIQALLAKTRAFPRKRLMKAKFQRILVIPIKIFWRRIALDLLRQKNSKEISGPKFWCSKIQRNSKQKKTWLVNLMLSESIFLSDCRRLE